MNNALKMNFIVNSNSWYLVECDIIIDKTCWKIMAKIKAYIFEDTCPLNNTSGTMSFLEV